MIQHTTINYNFMTISEFTDQVKAAAGKMPNLGKSLKLSLDGGAVHIDLTGDEAIVSNEDKDADCTIITTIDNLVKLRNGELNPMSAFMTGKVKVKGDMGLAMKLQSLFS